MHVTGPLTNNHADPEIRRRIDAAESRQAPAAAAPEQTGSGSSATPYVSAPELAELREQLQRFKDVRPEVVQAVAQRVAAGEFSGLDVSLRTAAAILDS